jgi:hypothetical protein
MQTRSAQKLAWENKVAKGFNTTEVPLEFCLLQGEIAEAFDAWHKGRENVGEELADVAIYLLSLAEMTGIDLQDPDLQKTGRCRSSPRSPPAARSGRPQAANSAKMPWFRPRSGHTPGRKKLQAAPAAAQRLCRPT